MVVGIAACSMCFWRNEVTGEASQQFGSVAEAQAAWGPWQLGHPGHQAGWVLDEGDCAAWKAAVALQQGGSREAA